MKNNKILWIEDESYMVEGLFEPLQDMGVDIVIVKNALQAYQEVKNWQQYDIVVVDLIIPLCDSDEDLPEIVKNWEREPYVGIGFAKWFTGETDNQCPVLLLSVIENPIGMYSLSDYGLTKYLSKSGLLPSMVKKEILNVMGESNET